MNTEPKTSISPMLSVRNGKQAVDFYKTAFGATELFLLDNGGAIVAQLSVDGADFWLADEAPEHANFSPESLDWKSQSVPHLATLANELFIVRDK